MNTKQYRILKAVFERPTLANIDWKDIENLLLCLGGVIKEREGSRIAVYLNGVVGYFHRPHPQKHAQKGLVENVRKFLVNAGCEPGPEEK